MSENEYEKLLGVVRELYGRVVWTHKTHKKDREIWSGYVSLVRWVNVLLIGITTILASVGTITNSSSNKCLFILTTVFGALSTAFVVYQLSFNPEKMESAHRLAAKSLLRARDSYLLLINKIMNKSTTIEQLEKEVEHIQHEVSLLYDFAPDSSSKAYSKAGIALKKNEELTFSTEEIDLLLPESLRIGDKKE